MASVNTYQSIFVLRIAAVLITLLAGSCVNPTPPRVNAVADGDASYSITPAITAPFAYGVASGDMTSESAVLWTRTPGLITATVIPELSLTPSFDHAQALPEATTSDAGDHRQGACDRVATRHKVLLPFPVRR